VNFILWGRQGRVPLNWMIVGFGVIRPLASLDFFLPKATSSSGLRPFLGAGGSVATVATSGSLSIVPRRTRVTFRTERPLIPACHR